MGKVGLHGDPHPAGEIVDAHAGDNGGTGLGLVGVVGDHRIGGIGLGALQEMGQGVGDLQPVFQYMASHDQGRKNVGVFDAHAASSSEWNKIK